MDTIQNFIQILNILLFVIVILAFTLLFYVMFLMYRDCIGSNRTSDWDSYDETVDTWIQDTWVQDADDSNSLLPTKIYVQDESILDGTCLGELKLGPLQAEFISNKDEAQILVSKQENQFIVFDIQHDKLDDDDDPFVIAQILQDELTFQVGLPKFKINAPRLSIIYDDTGYA